ncbi:Phosphatidylinositol kinase (PIK-I) [Plasmopara halstedii]|uniref:Phosphatidylinositol kinase (PIK-I) n=1 Tax=Plasmopara halstedii TaxID=4781 RepID=A0A0P1AK01_PLAHL|nr:Phosphatidylinositol kinase (PIK-I) [Plasmopara halstedii]CEG41184.1 Phosphatidylinositol kinase (PIK-I) [Plasmopara halstedii]|eukprot:XP_024577553.1 Phosphatidylinositol kinase (PIK-I) [Plasmopara halstedii]
MGTSQFEGVVRIRERVIFSPSSADNGSNDSGDHSSLISCSRRQSQSISRLSDDVWYFCVSRAPIASLEWYTLDASTDSSEEENGSPFTSYKSNILLTKTQVTSVEAVDGENVMLPENEYEPGVFVNWTIDEQERKQLESVSFYIEDKVVGVALLIEAESHSKRDAWVTFLSKLLFHSDTTKKYCGHGSGDILQCGGDTAKEREVQSASTTSSISTRSLLHQGKSENLIEDGDIFGLLSLTTSAICVTDEQEPLGKTARNAAPGMFQMDHFELLERLRHEEDVGNTSDSDVNVLFSDSDCVADTVLNSTLLSSKREQQNFSRERVSSNSTDPLISSRVREGGLHASSRRHSTSSVSNSETKGCFRCSKKFGRLIHTPKVCVSCTHRFCRDHCNQWTILTTPESITVLSNSGSRVGAKSAQLPGTKRVCMDCYVRQQLLSYLQEVSMYYASTVEEAGGISRLVRWKYFDQGPKHEIERHVRARSLGPLSLLSAMFKYRQQPFMFVVVLAQLIHNVENCMNTMEFYWPQFLQWGFVHLSDASPSVRAFYLFFLAATARRSVRLAVKATWECIAAHWDAMTGGFYQRGNGIVVMLFFVTNINFGDPRCVFPQLLFPLAPLHQRESLTTLLYQLFEFVRRTYAASQRESPFFEWLLARSKEETVASSRNIQMQLHIGDGFLDPFPTDYHEEFQLMMVERRRSGTQHLVETKQRLWNTPALHCFSDEFRLVRYLVDLCTYLKENISEPSQRKKQLPALLQRMLYGKYIRPDAALPLSGVVTYSHRVVNVLTDEGTVFSTKARAPTLVYFEIVASSSCDYKYSSEFDGWPKQNGEINALVDAALNVRRDKFDYLEFERQEILDYLDGECVGTYVADLIPISRNDSQGSISSSISDKIAGLSQAFPTSYPSQSVFAHDSDDFDFEGRSDEDSMGTWDNSDFTNTTLGTKCPFFGERFADTQKRIREESNFSRFDGWSLVPVIAKSFDDMRQEVFVLQGLKLVQLIFRKHNLNLWMRYYDIVCAGKDCGLLEVITDAQSLDGLKKKGTEIFGVGTSLSKIFERACGRDPIEGKHDPLRLERARANFITSMAAYSLFSYIFLVKDRHNGNIMLDTEGHIVHIDFGFVLGIAPGNTFSLETAPFKLTSEMVEVMGVVGFDRYRRLVAQGLQALHLEAQQLMSLVYLSSKDSSFPCFKGQSRARIIRRLSRRLCIGWSASDVERVAARIVDKSHGHRGTRQYDWFQKITNGILP